MMRYALTLCFALTGFTSLAQNDSLKTVLSLDDFLQVVMTSHPVMKQADLIEESADAKLLQARGGFDPKISTSYDLKNFKDKEYWDLFNATLKFQTRSPIQPKITVDRNEGLFINRERSIPDSNDNRQVSAGISLPLGKGLLIDERRLALKQAKIYQDYAAAERIKVINKILLTSMKDYWNWYVSYKKLLLIEQSLDIANILFDRVMIDYNFGELAVVDTIQAGITLQSRQADYEKTKFELENSRLMLATHLWSPEEQPLELQSNVIPDVNANFGSLPSNQGIEEMIEWASSNHPEIQKINNKVRQYEVDNLWYKEALKPQLDLSYAFIDAPINSSGEGANVSFSDNYKLGVDFSFPIFLRKERGKLRQNKVKIKSTVYERSQEQLKIRNNILSKYAETKMTQTLSQQYQAIADNYDRLLQAEFINLDTGESDLFKLNVQQDKLISAQLKYLENLVKFQKNKAEILYDIGLPFLSLQ